MVDTYRYLRGGMAVMIVMLTVGVLIERATSDHWLTSISAYYHSAARNVFVASLCALGTLLIVYRGDSSSEDQLLNLAGLMAFVVAFVPIPAQDAVADPSVIDPGVVNSISALIAAIVVAQVLSWFIARVKGSERPPLTTGGWLARIAMWIVVVAGLLGFFGRRGSFDDDAHLPAAVVLFVAITLVVFISAWLTYKQDDALAPHRMAYCRIYLSIATYMVLSAVGTFSTVVLYPAWEHRLLVVEVLLIAGFAGYWTVQTVQLWNVRGSLDLVPPQVRDDVERTASGDRPKDVLDGMRELRSLPAGRRLNRLL
ncbi:hypothetical protein ASJ79_10990 [Mycobacterium sp. NAZ190054]|nr:hypothetical protein ASJ79_10990 [Mycobacterium sp. NAZ190054]